MKIYRALLKNLCSQGYDCNPSMVQFYLSCGLAKGIHGGMDWWAETGDPLYYDCDIDGYILNTEIDGCGGLGVNIITESEEGIFKHRYWHLKDFFVKAGDKISMGECIGWADNTGNSTGSHLHRDVKEMIRNSNGSLSVKYPTNGAFGAIRFDKWFENKFVLDMVESGKKQSYLRKVLEAFLRQLLLKIK
jgi:hypothetical protein